MAYIVGLVSKAELADLHKRGWEDELPPLHFVSGEEAGDSDPEMRARMFFVDSDLYKIMTGPDWEPPKVELKPCPFCGKPGETNLGGFGEWYVTCSDDNCGGRLGTGILANNEHTAAEIWNRRMPTELERRCVDLLRLFRNAMKGDEVKVYGFGSQIILGEVIEKAKAILREVGDDDE